MRRVSVSALRWRARRFQRRECALVGVERMGAAEGDGLVAAGVAEGGAEDDGNVKGGQALGDGVLAPRGVFAGAGEVADDEGLGFVQGAAEEQLGEEAVEAVGGFVEVFEEDDGAAEVRLERGAAHGGESREVAAGGRALGATFGAGPWSPGGGRRGAAGGGGSE